MELFPGAAARDAKLSPMVTEASNDVHPISLFLRQNQFFSLAVPSHFRKSSLMITCYSFRRPRAPASDTTRYSLHFLIPRPLHPSPRVTQVLRSLASHGASLPHPHDSPSLAARWAQHMHVQAHVHRTSVPA
ncbi:hypothetical protein C0Q70_09968 [Pomacea canaliculata]|uniref:Uncharacterized protein n=1 Tax=Pomacea canaliculata TaxID=400727 RepID=A0A2T7PB93_POMCA|nr:hypothetical protein C0Q70_09968 [Pomacea canaliculata]